MNTTRMLLIVWTAVTLTMRSGATSGAEPADQGKSDPGGKPAATALCDDDWEGNFWTVAINKVPNAGRVLDRKDYDPKLPNEPWHASSERFLRTKDCCGDVFLHKSIGRFHDRKDADSLLKRVYASSDFARHLNPRYPPFVSNPGALLVSDKYTCTLDKENDTLTTASWIVELDGNLYAGGETACKQGRKKKRVSIVGCDGKKVLANDTWTAPCDGSAVRSCIVPIDKSAVAVWQDFSASGEGRQTSFRVYDADRGKLLVTFKGGGDWEAGGGWFREFTDRDPTASRRSSRPSATPSRSARTCASRSGATDASSRLADERV